MSTEQNNQADGADDATESVAAPQPSEESDLCEHGRWPDDCALCEEIRVMNIFLGAEARSE